MAKIEKSIFISYRRTNIFHARATFQDLRANDYDVFMDYETMNAGDFDQIIINQIKARAHFLLILTPSALERCSEPTDWLRREIETAIDSKRNIIPLMFDGFDWNSNRKYLTGKLEKLPNFNALPIPAMYFDEAMNRLRTRFLNVETNTILYPTPKADEPLVKKKIEEATQQPAVTEAQLSASEYLERGNRNYYAGHFEEAIADYTDSIRLDPQNANTYYNRGVIYQEEKQDYDRAIADYGEAIRLNPRNTRAYTGRGLSYKNKGSYDLAIADYSEAIRINPKYTNAYVWRGTVYQELHNYDLAIADYTDAILLDPRNATAYHNRGVSYDEIENYNLAIDDYTEVIRLIPQHDQAYNNRGYIYLKKGDYERAIEDINQALKLNPQNSNAYDSRAEYYLLTSDYDRAIADYDRALQLNPNLEISQRNRELALQKKQGE